MTAKQHPAALIALTLAACEPEAAPAIYAAPEHAEAAQAWADAADLWAPVIPSDGPDGPGLWLHSARDTGWIGYDSACVARETFARGTDPAYAWAALSGGAAYDLLPERIGTAFPPPGVRPTLRLDDDQARAIRQGWADLENACNAAGIFSGVP